MRGDQSVPPTPATQQVPLGRTGVWTGGFGGLDVGALGEAAREIEELGYGAVWSGEAPGSREVFTQSLALLGATERLAFGAGIMNIYLRDAGVANAAARTVAALHPGRFVLGVGVSHRPIIEGMLGLEYGKPLATMRTYLDAMEAAPFGAPEGRTPGPPVLIAALGPKMIELARERTEGSHPYLVTPEHTRQSREILGAGKILAVEQGVVLTTDRAVGLARGRRHLETYKSLPNYRNNWLRLGFTDEETQGELSDRLVEALVVWGDEEAIAARVAEHHGAGADHVCVQVFGEDPTALPMSELRRLAPALTGA
jgi:probable F420-dependent oxidoreductase